MVAGSVNGSDTGGGMDRGSAHLQLARLSRQTAQAHLSALLRSGASIRLTASRIRSDGFGHEGRGENRELDR